MEWIIRPNFRQIGMCRNNETLYSVEHYVIYDYRYSHLYTYRWLVSISPCIKIPRFPLKYANKCSSFAQFNYLILRLSELLTISTNWKFELARKMLENCSSFAQFCAKLQKLLEFYPVLPKNARVCSKIARKMLEFCPSFTQGKTSWFCPGLNQV